MAKVILMHEGTIVREYILDKERTTIGRKPDNDIQLDDPTVSGGHAALLLIQNVYIEDLNSTNGVLLNGKKVSKRQLKHGDIVRIGRHELKFVDEKTNSFDSTVVLSPGQVTPAAETDKPHGYVVKVTQGPNQGKIIELARSYTTLGRPGLQVAVIARRGTSYYMMPMGGTGDRAANPRINGEPMSAASVPLTDGDILEVAGDTMCFTAAE
ncbi:MAG TPA: FHA domain-containing protein [Gammaproteobacteria bacterium]|nr:FHA domain-containing protein [Gammaproteobacteria bacterium]